MPVALRLAVLLLLGACGLVPPEPIGFRSYPLRDVSYEEAAVIVHDVTRRFAVEHWGGVTLAWDPASGNLALDPIYRPQQRLRLYLHLEPAGPDVQVEMFALVETLRADAAKVGWTDPKQDVPLEERLYAAFVAELVARRGGAP